MCHFWAVFVKMADFSFLTLYRRAILGIDVVSFFLKQVSTCEPRNLAPKWSTVTLYLSYRAIFEYWRQVYRFFRPRDLCPISGEVALVTGAGQGIGREVALQMARLGAVIVAVDINEETNNDTVRVIQQVVLKFKPYIILPCLLYCYNQQEVPNGVAFGYTCDVSSR